MAQVRLSQTATADRWGRAGRSDADQHGSADAGTRIGWASERDDYAHGHLNADPYCHGNPNACAFSNAYTGARCR